MWRKKLDPLRITWNTKAIVAVEHAYYRSAILNQHEKHLTVKSVKEIMNYNCKKFGVPYERQKSNIKTNYKIHNKIPIPISTKYGVYMVPIKSERNPKCVFLNYYQVYTTEAFKQRTIVHFYDDTRLEVDVSENTVSQQLNRTGRIIANAVRELFYARSN